MGWIFSLLFPLNFRLTFACRVLDKYGVGEIESSILNQIVLFDNSESEHASGRMKVS